MGVIKLKWVNYGLQLLSGGLDGLLKIWNVKKSVVITVYDLHQSKIWAIDSFNNGQ